MNHIVVDLEMNNVSQKNHNKQKCTMETIEIGAVMLDDSLQEISSFKTYVKPEYNNSIVPRITKLTGITNEMIANAPKFKEAFEMFSNWCMKAGNDFVIYSWSDSDYEQLMREIALKDCLSSSELKIMDKKWIDFQKKFDKHIGFDRQVSLTFALEMAGIDFVGNEHDALDDAKNTAELLHIFLDDNLFNKTLRKIKEVLEPTSIGVTFGDFLDASISSMFSSEI